MNRSTLLLLAAALLLLGGAILVAQPDPQGASMSSNDGTRIEAPGTTVETDQDKTRVQAPGVDITVPRRKDGD